MMPPAALWSGRRQRGVLTLAEKSGHTVSATEMVSLRDLRREVTSVRSSCKEEGGNCDMVLMLLQ